MTVDEFLMFAVIYVVVPTGLAMLVGATVRRLLIAYALWIFLLYGFAASEGDAGWSVGFGFAVIIAMFVTWLVIPVLVLLLRVMGVR